MSDDGPEYAVDFRDHPERYEIGRGETGAFKVEPSRSELLPLWSYADEAAARGSDLRALPYRRYSNTLLR